jgi:3-oxoacyl-[acyl-carrier-protein] synthase-3
LTFARITGTGSYLPERVLSNAELEKLVETSDEWITSRTGIRERRIAAEGETTGDLAFHAATRALEAAGIKGSELDMIVLGTTTPDIIFPSTACLLQARLGANGCAAFDVNAACSGFMYALGIADKFIRCGQARKALVVGAETLSRMMDWTDRSTCVLFGDGSGAVLMGPEDDPKRGVLSTHLFTDGSLTDSLLQPAGGSREPITAAALAEKRNFVKMNGREVYKHAVKNMAAASKLALETNGLSIDDVTWVLAHQANLRIIEGVSERVGIGLDRFYLNVERYGNTSSASVPIAVDEAIECGRITEGTTVLLVAFGAGFTWASMVVRF